MGFNYGLEKKKFDRQWAIMRKQYEDAGMSIEVIQAMYEYDWSVFNAARSYQNHTQEIAAPSFEQGEEAYSPLMNKYQEAISITEHYRETKSRFTWIGEIEDERLLSALGTMAILNALDSTKLQRQTPQSVRIDRIISGVSSISS